MLGDGERLGAGLTGVLHELVDPAGAVEQRELRVQVEVNEFGHRVLSVVGSAGVEGAAPL